MLKILKPEANKNVKEQEENISEFEPREVYTPTRSVRINSTLNDVTNKSRNMVSGVLNDSTNQPKRAKIRPQSQSLPKERPIVARALFATDKNDKATLPMLKALTASLPIFDGKSVNLNYSKIFSVNVSSCTRT